MPHHSSLDSHALNRRRWSRVVLAVPVELSSSAFHHAAESLNVSPGGLSVTVQEPMQATPDELLRVSVTIPLEARRLFPFSRLSGLCRIVRVEPASTPGSSTQMALAFCEEHTTRFGAAI